ncbi:MAG: hypothetical protein ABI794_15590 [Betaproteobacteria bacterium]
MFKLITAFALMLSALGILGLERTGIAVPAPVIACLVMWLGVLWALWYAWCGPDNPHGRNWFCARRDGP